MTPHYRSRLMGKRDKPAAEHPEPVPPDQEPEQPTEPGQELPPADEPPPAERPEEPESGPLSQLQEKLEALLDYDQVAEIRLALLSRAGELEKHTKKGSDLGVREEDARRRLRIIQGSDTRFGLCRIFAERPVTEQRDVFFDREKANGRPDGDADETITFRTVDGRDVTCHLDRLEADHFEDIRALYRAGKLPIHLENAAMDADLMQRIEDSELETAGVAE